MLGSYGPSSETIRRLHTGKISPEQVDLVILAAAYLGKTRLIDNLLVDIHTSA